MRDVVPDHNRVKGNPLMLDATIDPLKSSAPLIVYLDIKSPYAYLAVEPTYAMARELGIAIDWRPFTLDIVSYLGAARLNAAGKVVEEKRSSGQWTRVKYAYHDVRRYGSLRGIVIKGAVKMWDSSRAGMGMLWAKAQGDAVLRKYLEIVYSRFWKRELDLEDTAAIEGALSAAAADIAGFREYIDGAGRVAYAALQSAAFEAGIFGVPTYVVEGETYFGREHLPQIQWILSGRCGAAPDVNYPVPASAAAPALGSERRELEVAIDFNSPQSYLAIAPTLAMAKGLGIAIAWRPFIGTPSKFVAASDDRATRHRQIRSAYLERDVIRYADARGLRLTRLHDRQDPTLAAIGLLWAQRHNVAQAYLERVFSGYWEGRLNIDDLSAINTLLTSLGAPRDGFDDFADGAGRDELAAVQTDLRARGVFDAPSYIVEDDVFFGRQHLPLIRARLTA